MQNRKKYFFTFFRIFVSGAIFYYIFTRPDMNIGDIIRVIQHVELPYIIIGGLIYGFVLLAGLFRWILIVKSLGLKLSYGLGFKLTFIGLFFNNLMPSLTGGDIIKGYYIAKGTQKKIEAIASIVLDRAIGLSAVIVLAAMGAISVIHVAELHQLAYLTLAGVAVFIVGIGMFLNEKIMKRIPLAKRLLDKIGLYDRVEKLYYTLVSLTRTRKTFITVVLLSLMIQSSMVIMNFVIAKGLGLTEVSLGRFFIFIPIAGIISAIPISFAGWGIGEGAYKTLFKLIDASYGAIAVALSITCRLIILAWSLIGLPIYILYRHIPIESMDE